MKSNLKISTLIFLICFLFQNSYSQQNINGWYWMNGQPQSMQLNWIKILNTTTIYAVGNNGNFMRSTDGGDYWVINSDAGPIDNSSTSGGGTRNLATAWFFDANTGLVGGASLTANGDAIGRTTDGGATFTKISLGAAAHSVLGFYFINSTTGYACGNATTRLYKTTDAGISWTAVPNVPASLTFNAVFAFDENKIIITSSSRRIARTTDAGSTWKIDTLPGTLNTTMTDIGFKDANTGYITGNGNYFGLTTNGGANWVQQISPGASGQRDLKIVGNDVYTAGDNTQIHKTTDAGLTWSSINFIDGSNPNQPSPFIIYGMDINGSDFAVVGANGVINISNDGGATWRNKNYCVPGSGMNFSTIWSDNPSGNIWMGGTAGNIVYSSNGGANWSLQPVTSTVATNSIRMLNSTTGYFVSGSSTALQGNLFKTTNAGTNWIQITIPAPYSSRNAVDVEFIDENTGWVIGGLPFISGGGIICIKTTDGGTSWTAQPNDIGYDLVSVGIDMVDANTGYFIAGTALSIFKTTNGGTNWNRIPSSPGGGTTYNKIRAISSSVVFVSGGNGLLYKSTNGGDSWNSISVPTPVPTSTFFAMDWMDDQNGLIGATSGFLAKTSNGGLSWKTFNSGGSTIRDVCIRNRDSVYAVSDINGLWQVFKYTEPTPTKLSSNLTVGIEGFWNGATQVSDTIMVTLRNQSSPYNAVDQSSVVINNSGYATVTFNSAPTGNYYIQITHRNSLETCSGAPVYLSANVNDYDFTTAASKAYGSNMILKSGRYCDYSGDVNQDGFVNLTDVLLIFNASSVFTTGYVVTDVNGDDIVDLTDITIGYNNSTNFVTKVTP